MNAETTATVESTPQGATPATAVNAGQTAVDAPIDGATPSTPQGTNPTPDASDNQAPQGEETPEQLKARLQSAEARIRELNKENEKRRKAAEELEKANLAEQGKFKELYEKAQAELAQEQAERARIERERLLDSIAAKHKLPDALRSRLQGETEADLEADAVELAKLIKAPAVTLPDIGAQNGGGAKPGVLDEARQEEIRRRYRI